MARLGGKAWRYDDHQDALRHHRTSTRTPRLVVAILVVALVATPVLAFPYVLLDRDASRIDVQTDLAWVALVIHVPAASLAMILGGAAVRARIRARRQVHRAIGRAFLGLGTVAFVVTGIPLAITTRTATSPGSAYSCPCWRGRSSLASRGERSAAGTSYAIGSG